MRLSLVVICLAGAAINCSGAALNPGGTGGTGAGTGGAAGMAGTGGDAGASGGTAGTGGTPGTGGTAGTTGTAGTGGAAGIGGAPACIAPGQGDVVEFAIVGSDGMPIEAPVTATVSVASIDSCAQVSCPTTSIRTASGSISAAASRFTLMAPGPQEWTLYLRDSAMPSDLIKVGDTFDLTIDAGLDPTFYETINQTMVLGRGGDLILFAASLSRFYHLATPALDGFGIQISDAGAFPCSLAAGWAGCQTAPHAAYVAVGGDQATLGGGQTSTIAWLSFTNASFTELDDTGGCDSKSGTIMAGFRSP
jgi:hypothetical protein